MNVSAETQGVGKRTHTDRSSELAGHPASFYNHLNVTGILYTCFRHINNLVHNPIVYTYLYDNINLPIDLCIFFNTLIVCLVIPGVGEVKQTGVYCVFLIITEQTISRASDQSLNHEN